ncbi:glycoside hydrolase family 3 C-terminal domain-containing protein [Olivibacter sp. SDN3]|uniref:glycoside hydrolase family 3 N-terminal domain-containing protein n=1 Tax=Olivibacter sp. SDN3 TaxID=2764720 RepID=UPI00165161FE|nr:glycoside hydrolase family 3 N-terminal domain-containing protein [Olivibacter sp. SDN3]QNL48414.1 glycoside hydrolase family 3 C-terminal domain-containing protein [Olivibacter sp. SDN3]
MNKYYYLSLILITCFSLFSFKKPADKPAYKNASLPINQRVDDLLSQMTLAEKVGQLSTLLGWEMYKKTSRGIGISDQFREAVQQQHIGMLWATLRADPWTKKTLENGLSPEEAAQATNALQKYMVDSTRLGIPLLLAEECPHGHMAIGTTVFPTAIGQASTWNPSLINKMAKVIAKEARSTGSHIGYGPILDLARDPRWSRLEETYGEDPVLNAKMGIAMVKGFQGNDLTSGKNIISTLKHFTAYGVPEGGHNGGSVSIGLRELYQSYLPPFHAAVNAGALSVMTAYNSIDGIPCSANPWLLKETLKNDWNFKGFVVSDLGSISGIAGSHHTASDPAEAAAQAINAGLDADLSGYGFGDALLEAINEGKVSEETLNASVRRVLEQKFALGLFEKPYADVHRVKSIVRSKEHVALARKVAQESIILLKNDQQTLPLSKAVKKIAVVGPNAHNIYNQLGDYTAPQANDNIVTVLKGIQQKLGNTVQVNYVKGCDIRDTTNTEIEEAVNIARKADVTIVVLGGSSARDFKTSYQETGAAEVKTDEGVISDMESGEGFDRATLDMLGHQIKLLQAIYETGTKVVLVTIKGRPLNLNWAQEHIPAIIDAWYPGQEGGHAIADVLFGDYNPAGRLSVSVPKAIGQLPIYYNYRSPSRHDYVEVNAKPLYSFGYGLSYTSFTYSDLSYEMQYDEGQPVVKIQFTLKNTGEYDGDEVIQLYVRDEVGSTVTPIIQLKDFKRIHLNKGEENKIYFELTANDLKLMNSEMKWVAEKGKFKLLIGSASDDIKLSADFELEQDYYL